MIVETPKPLILIVDDMPANIHVLAEGLKADYRIKVATSGKAALEILSMQGQPDLILLDVMMPEMDGYEVCHQLKQNPETSGVPVIFITARNGITDEERGFQLGAVDYITKPFHLSIVRARLQNHLRLKLMTNLLEAMAWLDGLTCIPNRRRFNDVLEAEWKRTQRTGAPLSLILADIDHFKEFNDYYGHGAGDICLKKVAATLATSVTRAGDLAARYGGEEFVLLLPGTDIEGARLLAEQVRSSIEEQLIPHASSSVSNWVTISAGYASIIPSQDKDTSMLLEEADRMLYCAKRTGRNCVHGQ